MLNLVLVSGGYDSTVLSRFILKNKDNVVLYHCNFIDCNTSSQYYSFSILNREETLKFLNNKPENVDVLFSKISALKELDYDNIDGKIVRSSYIPSRNSMLVLDAVNKVYGKYPKDTKITIYLGLIKTNPQFPDGTIDWLNSINKLLEVEFGDRVHVECPFIDLDKDDVYKILDLYFQGKSIKEICKKLNYTGDRSNDKIGKLIYSIKNGVSHQDILKYFKG